jgi:hypothetical protein
MIFGQKEPSRLKFDDFWLGENTKEMDEGRRFTTHLSAERDPAARGFPLFLYWFDQKPEVREEEADIHQFSFLVPVIRFVQKQQ